MINATGRRPATFVFMAVAAYLTVGGVAASFLLSPAVTSELPLSPTGLAGLVLIFGLSVPVGDRPWTRTAAGLLATVGGDLALVCALLFLAPSPWLPAILFFILIPVSARLRPLFRYAFYAAAPLLTLAALIADGHFSEQWPSLASMVPGFIAMMVFAESFRAVREASQESNRLLDELVSAQGQLRYAAVIEERQRLAREMHDAIGHRLTVASIQLEAVSRLIESDPARAAELASISREQVRVALGELRSVASSLSAITAETHGLRRRIEETIAAFQLGCSTEVAADVDQKADAIEPALATVLLRCVQEGLTNIQRHARAAHARVSLAVFADQDRIELTIEDDGPGTSGAEATVDAGSEEKRPAGLSGGFGLRNLRERSAAVGGSMTFVRGENGARLSVTIPFERPTCAQ